MPKPLSPQSLRGDSRIDLDAQHDDFIAIYQHLENFDRAWEVTKAHILRRLSGANRKRHSAGEALNLADEREIIESAGYTGPDRRRFTPSAGMAA